MFILADYTIIFVALGVGVLFVILGANVLYKFYLWIIVAFLVFLVINCQIYILENIPPKEISAFQDFLLTNKDFILWLSLLSIPLLGILSAVNKNIFKKNILWILSFWIFLPFFLVGLLSYISENISVPLSFIESMIWFFDGSYFFELFRENLSWVILSLLFLIFYKAIFLLLYAFLAWIYEVLRVEFFWEREEKEEENWEGTEN